MRRNGLASGTILLVALIALLSGSVRAADFKPGEKGTTIGTLRDMNDEFLFIAAPGELPQRHYFPWVDVRRREPDPAMQAAAAKFKPGDRVEARWVFDGRLRIESLSPAPPETAPPAVAANTDQSRASHGNAGLSAAPVTTGEQVNGAIDNLLATGTRLLELPIFMLLAGVGIMGLALSLFIRPLLKRGKGRLALALLVTEGALLVLGVAFVIDRKIARLQDEVAELRSKNSTNNIELLNSLARRQPAGKRETFLVDPDNARKTLAGTFGDVSMKPVIYDEATDIYQLHIRNPLVQAYLAVIDLRHPDLEIKLGVNLDTKTLTSVFARENGCSVAINGEAGLSPAPGSGLGNWRGYLVRQGQVFLREDSWNPRPYLAFDRQNRARFTPAAKFDRSLGSDGFNVLWGRLDAIVNGVIQTADERNRQPRTVMGIDQDGTRLYLLVVDGRQPNYSLGFTRAEVGLCLAAFGAYNAMLCDEGGSSCIYLKQFGGISNIPSDNQGLERPTYTHFGIALRATE